MTRLLGLTVLALLLFLGAGAGIAHADTACTGAPADAPTVSYPEQRQFVDAQSWWQGPADSEPRHLHIGACVPEREQLTGTIHLDYKIQLHDNPDARVTYVAVVWESSGGDHTYHSVNPGWTCETAQCAFWIAFDIPVSAWDRSGLGAIRLRATAQQPNGKEMRASLNVQDIIDNDKPRSDMTRMPYLRGKGWYTGLNYCEAAVRTDITPLPDGPVLGGFTPWIRQLDHGSADADPTHHDVRLDPDIHNGIPGLFLLDGPGPFDGPVVVAAAPGLHRVFAKTDCATEAGVNSGVLVIPVAVV